MVSEVGNELALYTINQILRFFQIPSIRQIIPVTLPLEKHPDLSHFVSILLQGNIWHLQ